MPQKPFDDLNVATRFQKMGGEAVPFMPSSA